MSEGSFEVVRPFNPNKKTGKDIDEASDSYDTIDWLIKNIDNNNGNVGAIGISLRAEIMRGKFRKSFEKPMAFIPNKPTEVKYTMPDGAHTFKKGHKLMIQVQSSWFPLTDINP